MTTAAASEPTATTAAASEPTATTAAASEPTGLTAPARSGWLLLVAGVAGLIAALTLTIEKIDILINPNYVPSCSINPILSCGSVMITKQASVFGFPNPLLGIPTFAVVVTVGVLVVAGVALPRWFWAGLTLGSALGLGFIGWLIFQSLYRIDALCPYCMVVWAITPVIFVTALNRLLSDSRGILALVAEWRWTLVAVYYAVVLLLVFLRFQDYWLGLL